MDNAPRKAGRPPKHSYAPQETVVDSDNDEGAIIVPEITAGEVFPLGFEPISTAPKTGDRIVVSETGQDAIAVFWRERRVVNKEKLRYEKKGGWTGVLSRLDIDFEPKFWRQYSAADYIPIPRAV